MADESASSKSPKNNAETFDLNALECSIGRISDNLTPLGIWISELESSSVMDNENWTALSEWIQKNMIKAEEAIRQLEAALRLLDSK